MMLSNIAKKLLGFYPDVKKNICLDAKRFGNDYGGFNVFGENLNEKSIVYSFGIGEDISFDKAIINQFGCTIYAYDPTPKVQSWINTQNTPSQFKFYPIGLSHTDGTIIFYTPINNNHISHTCTKMSSKQKEVSVPCNKLSTILKSNGHTYIDLLKIDIEGFEYQVLENMLDESIDVKQLAVEFHHNFKGIGNKATERIIQKLIDSRYDLFSISNSYQEFSFLKR